MMTYLKMWCLLPLTVLLLLSISPTVTEVVLLMSHCEGFFLNKPPQIPGILENSQIKGDRYKIICQTYNNIRRFVTIYDTKNRIPVFSAYKYRGEEHLLKEEARPENSWKIEPQLEDMNDKNINMEDCDDKKTYTNQAGDNDYKNNNNYNRGHLFPSSYGFDESDKISTFTLTNIVPQAKSFNQGSWEKMEKHVKCILTNYCENHEGYVMTGEQPGTNTLNNTVNIPSMLWSAFCCYNHQNSKWIAGAFWGDNKPDGPKTTNLQMKTLKKLYDKLSTDSSSFEAFPGENKIPSKCPLKETAEESLRKLEIDKTCKYSPHAFTNTYYKDEEAL